ncbi:MAG: DUF2156 domain-containing protein [Muribaculaceae bacterium]|nr:DUF2156 domain-containing protein [Muribaculaceae bacterium]
MRAISTSTSSVNWSLPYNSPLHFKRITLEDIPEINRILRQSSSLTCDYSIGGIYMWIDYFRYRYCIYDDTLFIMGVEENHVDRVAFSCPIGKMPLVNAIRLLKDYCKERNIPLRFSAVPADRLVCFSTFNSDCQVEELTDWSDYVYEITSFATLSGKKMSKKRNHVNRFMADHPAALLEPLTADNLNEVIKSFNEWCESKEEENGQSTRAEERREVLDVLFNLDKLPFEGAILREEKGGKIVGFTLAEPINDTLFVHIEKMDHRVSGAGETLAHLFSSMMSERHPEIVYLNREEDCGDEGLRYAKESWHPAMLLKKYNVESL